MRGALYAEVIRSYIKKMEDEHCDGFDVEIKELKKKIQKIEKELTIRKWTYMLNLKKDDKRGDLLGIYWNLNSCKDLSIKQFAENVAEIKSIICHKIHSANFYRTDMLPEEYDLLDAERFKDTLYVLYDESHDESNYYSDY